jgi:ABC-type dipeptide/oligopeptide/nickel transport system ATPase component
VALLKSVRIASPETRVSQFPHEMSGGMRQRIVGAIGISCEPRLLIADEPTTSLDLTIQAQVPQPVARAAARARAWR